MQKYRPLAGEEGIPVLKIKELRQGMCDDSSELCSMSIKPDDIVSDGDVIFSWSGSLLVDFWCGGTYELNQHLFKITSSRYDKLHLFFSKLCYAIFICPSKQIFIYLEGHIDTIVENINYISQNPFISYQMPHPIFIFQILYLHYSLQSQLILASPFGFTILKFILYLKIRHILNLIFYHIQSFTSLRFITYNSPFLSKNIISSTFPSYNKNFKVLKISLLFRQAFQLNKLCLHEINIFSLCY